MHTLNAKQQITKQVSPMVELLSHPAALLEHLLCDWSRWNQNHWLNKRLLPGFPSSELLGDKACQTSAALPACVADWPGSAGCYPLTAVTMRVAVVGELVVSVLAWGLVGRQGLRAGCVDSASHEHLLDVAPPCPAASREETSSRYPSSERPVLSWCRPAALCRKPLAQHFAILTPPSLWITPPVNLSLSLSLSLALYGPLPPPPLPPPPPSAEPRASRIIRFHIYTQQNHPQRNRSPVTNAALC